jgi:hypothetical protein
VVLIDILQIHLPPKSELVMIEIWIRGFRIFKRRRGAQQGGMHMWQRAMCWRIKKAEKKEYIWESEAFNSDNLMVKKSIDMDAFFYQTIVIQ